MALAPKIPSWQLYGEDSPFPDLLHIERIKDRAAGLDWQIAAHRHLHLHQVFLILSGQVRLAMDGTTTDATPPVVMNIPRGTVHGFTFAAGTEGYVLTLPAADFPDIFGPDAAALPLNRAFIAPAPPGISAPFHAIAAQHPQPGPLRRLRLRAATLTLCCAIADAAPPDPANTPAQTPADPRITRFAALIHANLATNWQLADYARALALSERHLRRLCHDATGLSAHAFIEQQRCREACCLLAYTRMQVQEVGFALGYDDPTYFTRVFRRTMGMAPGTYRARLEQ